MVGTALAVAGGMLLAATGFFSPGVLFFAALLALLVAALFRKSSTVLFAVALISGCRFIVSAPGLSGDSVNAQVAALEGQSLALIGKVSDFPEFYPYTSGRFGTCSFPLACEGVQVSNHWKRLRGEIEVRVTGVGSAPVAGLGQRVRVCGEVRRRALPGRIPLELNVIGAKGVEARSAPVQWSPRVWGRAWREKAAVRLEQGMEGLPVQEAVLKALVLGLRKGVPPQEVARFRRTGSVHIFAISGLHVGMVALFLIGLLKAAGIPRDWFGVWMLPLLAMYVVATGMKASALRALAMATVFMLAPLLRRRPDIPTSVAFAAIVLLFFQPLEILSAGFVFSFTVVSLIVMVYTKVPPEWVAGGWLKSRTVSLVVTSFAASLAAIPLAALVFGTFSPISFLGNLIVVPLTFMIVLCGWLSVLMPVVSSVFNHAAVVFIDLLLGSVALLDHFPGAGREVAPPPLLAVLLWFGSLIYLFAHARRPKERWFAVVGAFIAIMFSLLGCA